MTSASPLRRPRPAHAATRPSPTPRAADEAALQARIDAFFAGHGEDEGPARGSLLSRLRLDARLRQRACISAIGAGVALFVVASVTTSLAGVDTAAHRAAVSHAHTSPLVILPATDATPTSSAVRTTVPRRPAQVARPAPAHRRAGSGLSANNAQAAVGKAVRATAPAKAAAAKKAAAGTPTSAAPTTPSSRSTRTSGSGGGSGASGGSSGGSSSAPTFPTSSQPAPSSTPTPSPTPTCHLTVGGLCL